MTTKKKTMAVILAVAMCLSTAVMAMADSGDEAGNSGSVKSMAASNDYIDTQSHWARDAISTVSTQGWMQGTSATEFSPDMSLNRGMFVTILGRMAGAEVSAEQSSASIFTDVAANAYYAPYVTWAYRENITSGTSAITFSPSAEISREQLATLLYNFAGSQNAQLPSGTAKSFTDSAEISTWANDAVNALAAAGVINGRNDGSFDPKGTATRAETAAILVNYQTVIGSEFTNAPSGSGDSSADNPSSPSSDGNSIVTNGGTVVDLSSLEHQTGADSDSAVYYTSDISPTALMTAYQALGWNPSGNTAVKLSTGEPPASNYLDPDLIKDLVQSVNATITECNTAYGGSRSNTAMHMQVAKDHGFTAIADVDIMDADGSMSLPVTGGSRLSEDLVGTHFANYDSFIVLSHFKGHAMAGFGGAIKNISIGMGSSTGKALIHSGGTSTTNMWSGEQDAFLEAMAEAGKAVSDSLNGGKNIVYVSVMNRLSVDCDCDGNPAEPDLHDIGILASADPVALDQACVDFVYSQKDAQGASLVRRIESQNGIHTLEHADEIGLGSRNYKLISLD